MDGRGGGVDEREGAADKEMSRVGGMWAAQPLAGELQKR